MIGRMSDPTTSLGLFPLQTVLVPGASLGLRIFETRYLDLIRECGRAGTGFGISLLLDAEDDAMPSAPAAFGTEAVIEDFGTGEDGLLTLRVRGARRFRANRVRVRDNGLQVAEVEWCPVDAAMRVRPEHALLATVLERVVEQVGGEYAQAAVAMYDDAAWVGWRLAELLPLELLQRQAVLQLDDPHARLDQLLSLVS